MGAMSMSRQQHGHAERANNADSCLPCYAMWTWHQTPPGVCDIISSQAGQAPAFLPWISMAGRTLPYNICW